MNDSDDIELLSDTKRLKLSWIEKKIIRKQLDGTLSGIFILILSALGTGIFAMHNFYHQVGIITGILIMFFVMLMFVFSSRVLINCLRRYPEASNLNSLIEKTLGKKFSLIFDLTEFIYLFLTLISIVLTISKSIYENFGRFIMEKIFKFQFRNEDDFMHHFETFNAYGSVIVGLILFPLVLT